MPRTGRLRPPRRHRKPVTVMSADMSASPARAQQIDYLPPQSTMADWLTVYRSICSVCRTWSVRQPPSGLRRPASAGGDVRASLVCPWSRVSEVSLRMACRGSRPQSLARANGPYRSFQPPASWRPAVLPSAGTHRRPSTPARRARRQAARGPRADPAVRPRGQAPARRPPPPAATRPHRPLAPVATTPPGTIPLVPQTRTPGTQLRPGQLAIGDCRTRMLA